MKASGWVSSQRFRLLHGVAMLGLVACAIEPRPAGEPRPDGAPVEPAPVDAPHATNPDAADGDADGPPVCGQLRVTLRDFQQDHPDMHSGIGTDLGLVQAALGADGKPVYAPAGATSTVSGQASFNQWYRDQPGVNQTLVQPLPLVEDPPGTFTFDDQSYFPLDGLGFGNEGHAHNYHFTSEVKGTFTYHGGEVFQFTGDDDVFVFVNGKLAVDLGGVHDPLSQTVDFDALQAELEIVPGQTYPLVVFQAERHTTASTFRMTTTIDCLIID